MVVGSERFVKDSGAGIGGLLGVGEDGRSSVGGGGKGSVQGSLLAVAVSPTMANKPGKARTGLAAASFLEELKNQPKYVRWRPKKNLGESTQIAFPMLLQSVVIQPEYDQLYM